jgi:tetratricopeptide (TPR) repeat protein
MELKSKKRSLTGALGIVLLVAVCYFPATQNDYIWDDDYYVTQNATLRSAHGLYRMWFELRAIPQYYPLVHTTYWLEYHLWGLKPLGYHIVNILLHAVNALLLWYILRMLAVPGAWLAAALFAIHPVHVESVAWITERKNVLSAFFYFLSFVAYMRRSGLVPASTVSGTAPVEGPFHLYVLSLILFIGALLSKTVTCSLPAVILLIIWWKRGRLTARDIAPLIPFFIIGAGLGLQTVWLEKHGVGAQGDEFNYGIVERFLIAGRAFWFYLEKLFWPRPLAFFYPRWVIEVQAWWQYIFPVAAMALLSVILLLQKKLGRGTAAAVLFFAGTLFPALGFFNVAPMRFSFVADHFQYLASIGPLALFSAALHVIFSKLPALHKSIKAAVIVAMLMTLGTLVWHQSHIYINEEVLWRDTLVKNPRSWIAHMNLGKTLFDQNRTDEAIQYFQDALRIKPNVPMALSNLGAAYMKKGQYEQALLHLKEAVQLYPDYAEAYYNLGVVSALLYKDSEAVEYFTASLRLMPESHLAYFNLGQILERGHNIEGAAHCYSETVRLNPDHKDARKRLDRLLPYLTSKP